MSAAFGAGWDRVRNEPFENALNWVCTKIADYVVEFVLQPLGWFTDDSENDHVHAATFDKGGVLDPGWNRVRNAAGRGEALTPPDTIPAWLAPSEFRTEFRTTIEATRSLADHIAAAQARRRRMGCHRCDNDGRKFFDGIDWRCWTCHRVLREEAA